MATGGSSGGSSRSSARGGRRNGLRGGLRSGLRGRSRGSSHDSWVGFSRGAHRRAASAGALTVAIGVLWLAAGAGASALGTVRSMAERARPRLVADLVTDFSADLSGPPLSGVPWAALPRAIAQRGPRDCGPAALATILAWRGRPVGEEAVLRLAHVRADGVTLAELARLAAAFELPGAWYAVPPDRLGSLPTPFLAHLRAGHFVAVRRLARGFVLLADPARGLVLERRARFVRAWSGRVLLFDAVLAERAAARRPLQHAESRP